MKKLLLFSGGFDSTILLLDNMRHGDDVTVMYVDYGQAVADAEISHMLYWVAKFNLPYEILRLPKLAWSKSTMLGEKGTGNEWDDEYVEMRNLIFLSYAISYAEAKEINQIEVGFINVPAHYPDTSPIFVDLMDMVGRHSNGVRVQAPIDHMTKENLFEYAKTAGYDLREVFDHTITCNTLVNREPCGECTGCKEIKKFEESL